MIDVHDKMITDKGEGFFCCMICGINFNSRKGFNIHNRKIHKVSGVFTFG